MSISNITYYKYQTIHTTNIKHYILQILYITCYKYQTLHTKNIIHYMLQRSNITCYIYQTLHVYMHRHYYMHNQIHMLLIEAMMSQLLVTVFESVMFGSVHCNVA